MGGFLGASFFCSASRGRAGDKMDTHGQCQTAVLKNSLAFLGLHQKGLQEGSKEARKGSKGSKK